MQLHSWKMKIDPLESDIDSERLEEQCGSDDLLFQLGMIGTARSHVREVKGTWTNTFVYCSLWTIK